MTVNTEDINHMGVALALARRGLGLAAPNPAVGCVIVAKNGQIAGRGWTQMGGRPHAEHEAIKRAGVQCRGATAYVTLEPCDHEGKTPPCSKALIKANIKRVVVACVDPDPRVSGRGIKRLMDAGIEVVQGILEKEAKYLNNGFFTRLAQGRPLFTLKAATTLDGRIATRSGHSKWITGPEARAKGHMLRARHDAIMIGIGTALTDKPQLTCRIEGMELYSPRRIIIDSKLQLPLSNLLVETANQIPTIILTATTVDKRKVIAFKKKGVKVIELKPLLSGRLVPELIANALGVEGLNSVLLEGGGKLAGSFISAGLIDHLAWFHAPKLIGDDGIPSIAAYGVESLLDIQSFQRTAQHQCGNDIYETYDRKNGN
jgi:diaminohydroxyphosphoribosylaminopyrimidine deaminase / 5-amino-6-(5-phosphoribosylamino)uracil reductase